MSVPLTTPTHAHTRPRAHVQWSMTEADVKLLDTAFAKLTPLVAPEKSPFPKKSVDTGLVMFDS